MPQTTLLSFLQPLSMGSTKSPISGRDTLIDVTPRQNSSSLLEESSQHTTKSEKKSVLEHLSTVTENVTKSAFFIPAQSPNTVICKIQNQHVLQIKQLTSTLLPVRYPDKFFSECVTDPLLAEISRVVLHESKPVGWVRCRLEPMDAGTNQLYIQAICILAPWRGLGLASALLEQVTKAEILNNNRVAHIYAHVWQSSEDALEWYEKRGFTRGHLHPSYYRRLRPAGAWIMQKQFGHTQLTT